MTDPEDIDPDDLVTEDQLQDAIESAVGDALEGADDGDHDHDDVADHESLFPDGFDPETDMVDPESARDVADQTFIERMRHLAFDECETEECARLRDQFGLDPSDDPEEDAETDEIESEGEPDETDANADEPEESEPEGAEESESGTDDVETNVFGEPV